MINCREIPWKSLETHWKLLIIWLSLGILHLDFPYRIAGSWFFWWHDFFSGPIFWTDSNWKEQFEMHETMSGKAPVILGGHEHTVFEEVQLAVCRFFVWVCLAILCDLFGMVKTWPFQRLLVTFSWEIKRSRLESPGVWFFLAFYHFCLKTIICPLKIDELVEMIHVLLKWSPFQLVHSSKFLEVATS